MIFIAREWSLFFSIAIDVFNALKDGIAAGIGTYIGLTTILQMKQKRENFDNTESPENNSEVIPKLPLKQKWTQM